MQYTIELVLFLDAEKFNRLLSRVHGNLEYIDSNKFVDQTLFSKGITITYHDRQYKKKVQFTVNSNAILDDEEPNENNSDKLVRKLKKRIDGYFNSKYTLDDLNLTGMSLITHINVRNREKTAAYIKVLQRVGKVKGFSPAMENWFNDDICFWLEGNSNGIEFMVCDLESLLSEQSRETNSENSKELKRLAKKAEGLLRTEVKLIKPKAIRDYTDENVTSNQIADLSGKGQKIFLDTFMRVVPFGDFYKKDRTVEIIRENVADMKIRQRMLRLLSLVPEKKSLLLAQKALAYRKIDEVMDSFAIINLSPVTLSKRHDVKYLKNLYSYFEN